MFIIIYLPRNEIVQKWEVDMGNQLLDVTACRNGLARIEPGVNKVWSEVTNWNIGEKLDEQSVGMGDSRCIMDKNVSRLTTRVQLEESIVTSVDVTPRFCDAYTLDEEGERARRAKKHACARGGARGGHKNKSSVEEKCARLQSRTVRFGVVCAWCSAQAISSVGFSRRRRRPVSVSGATRQSYYFHFSNSWAGRPSPGRRNSYIYVFLRGHLTARRFCSVARPRLGWLALLVEPPRGPRGAASRKKEVKESSTTTTTTTTTRRSEACAPFLGSAERAPASASLCCVANCINQSRGSPGRAHIRKRSFRGARTQLAASAAIQSQFALRYALEPRKLCATTGVTGMFRASRTTLDRAPPMPPGRGGSRRRKPWKADSQPKFLFFTLIVVNEDYSINATPRAKPRGPHNNTQRSTFPR